MKKHLFIVILLGFLFIPMQSVKAEKTLNQLISEAQANRAAYAAAQNQKSLTEREMNQARQEREKVEEEIENINKELEQIQIDIDKLQKQIKIKEEEIKNIMKFVQISNGETNYLEYIFGATDFTDFIYRISVAEQLGDYNDRLIKEYNADIEALNKKQQELDKKQKELSKKQQELELLELKLNKEISEIKEGMLSKDTEYKMQISMINNMKAKGCKGTDTLTSCQRRIGSSSHNLASTSLTTIPIASGYITSDYGYRIISGVSEFHTGIDFGASSGTAVYPVADGEVVLTVNNPSCGNHMVYVAHKINGHEYVTSYWHMSSYTVSKGQLVTTNTVIGYVAAPASVTGDRCGGGSHLHLNLFDNANGKWDRNAGLGYPNSGRIDPHSAINIPHPQKDGNGGYIPYPVSHK